MPITILVSFHEKRGKKGGGDIALLTDMIYFFKKNFKNKHPACFSSYNTTLIGIGETKKKNTLFSHRVYILGWYNITFENYVKLRRKKKEKKEKRVRKNNKFNVIL